MLELVDGLRVRVVAHVIAFEPYGLQIITMTHLIVSWIAINIYRGIQTVLLAWPEVEIKGVNGPWSVATLTTHFLVECSDYRIVSLYLDVRGLVQGIGHEKPMSPMQQPSNTARFSLTPYTLASVSTTSPLKSTRRLNRPASQRER
jgi:hypothetical protein